MEGYEVMPAAEAARFADVWVTVTGNCKVIDGPAFENRKTAPSSATPGTSTPRSTSAGWRSTP